MYTKILLLFILLFLVFLLLFYYLKLKTNIIFLLSIIIVLCINKLIIQTEFFEDDIKYNIIDIIQQLKIDANSNSNSTPKLTFMGSSTNSVLDRTTKKILSNDEILNKLRNKYKPKSSDSNGNSKSNYSLPASNLGITTSVN